MTLADFGDDTDQNAQLQPEDTLSESGVSDVLDEGYSPPERPWNTRDHESLDERLADEEPDPWNAADPATDPDEVASGTPAAPTGSCATTRSATAGPGA